MPNPRDPQTVTSTVIPSQWGQDVNDRVVQVFQNVAALRGPHADYTPQIGSLAYTIDERGLWRYVGTTGGPLDPAPGGWESALPRGLLGTVRKGTSVVLANGPTAWTNIMGLGYNIGNIRQGCTYLVSVSGAAFTQNNTTSLWGAQVYITNFVGGVIGPEGTASVYNVMGGWVGGMYSSRTQSAVWPIGPMPLPSVEGAVFFRGQTYQGQPPVTVNDARLSVVEIGGPS